MYQSQFIEMLKGKAINGTISDLVAPKIANVKKTAIESTAIESTVRTITAGFSANYLNNKRKGLTRSLA